MWLDFEFGREDLDFAAKSLHNKTRKESVNMVQFWFFVGFLLLALGGYPGGVLVRKGGFTLSWHFGTAFVLTVLGVAIMLLAGLGFIYTTLMAFVLVGLGASGDEISDFVTKVAEGVERGYKRRTTGK